MNIPITTHNKDNSIRYKAVVDLEYHKNQNKRNI